MDFTTPAYYRVKIKDKNIPGSCQRTKKAVEHERDNDTNSSCSSWNGSQRSRKEARWGGDNWRKNQDYIDQSSLYT